MYLRLETLKEEEWSGDVTVVSSDMREWNSPEKVRHKSYNIPIKELASLIQPVLEINCKARSSINLKQMTLIYIVNF